MLLISILLISISVIDATRDIAHRIEDVAPVVRSLEQCRGIGTIAAVPRGQGHRVVGEGIVQCHRHLDMCADMLQAPVLLRIGVGAIETSSWMPLPTGT